MDVYLPNTNPPWKRVDVWYQYVIRTKITYESSDSLVARNDEDLMVRN